MAKKPKAPTPKQITLTVGDRISIPGLLPQQGGLVTMCTVRHIAEAIAFSSDDIASLQMKDLSNGKVEYSGAVAEFMKLDVTLTPEMVELLKAGAKKADEAQGITLQLLPLIEKIEAL